MSRRMLIVAWCLYAAFLFLPVIRAVDINLNGAEAFAAGLRVLSKADLDVTWSVIGLGCLSQVIVLASLLPMVLSKPWVRPAIATFLLALSGAELYVAYLLHQLSMLKSGWLLLPVSLVVLSLGSWLGNANSAGEGDATRRAV